ncbi:hypothetical protein CEXT_163801 [Caerostris extrusa]|uniref:Uncharacterized protein n=1 Tax=Caerostris extrusa TaxID=172846 RepID=A0AAV4XQP2_CAEEX|nr:hypothetical protein CEXT_163801 [Caerostris extrusa]
MGRRRQHRCRTIRRWRQQKRRWQQRKSHEAVVDDGAAARDDGSRSHSNRRRRQQKKTMTAVGNVGSRENHMMQCYMMVAEFT